MWQTIQASSLEDVHLLALSREAKVMRAVEATGAKIKAVSLVPVISSVVISIEKQYDGEPKNVVAAAFGAYSWLKYGVVVDHDVDVFDINDVWWAMATRSNVQTGLLQMNERPGLPARPVRHPPRQAGHRRDRAAQRVAGVRAQTGARASTH